MSALVSFTPGEDYYLLNHIDVLGLELGTIRCARQMEKPQRHIYERYLLLKERQKEKTRQIAV
ncbi:hypothetical protein P4641_21510 [Halalkalibacterium halodurans]|uniref:hypothetical protein n=1 Tax=Halalkalibacterium halodurans TaxID=86665 RepID=UPI002E1F0152|nr:hypothetical protein [Halalkalibacterium halodurans]